MLDGVSMIVDDRLRIVAGVGSRAEGWLGHPLCEIVDPCDQTRVAEFLKRARATGHICSCDYVAIDLSDDCIIWLLRAVPLSDDRVLVSAVPRGRGGLLGESRSRILKSSGGCRP